MTVLRKTALAIALAAGASAAVADPLTQLFFRQSSGWLNPEFDYNGGGTLSFADATGPDAPASTFSTMNWTGADAGTSSISLTNFTSDDAEIRFNAGGADLDGEWNAGDVWSIDKLIQTNQVLLGGPFPNPLWVADTVANLRIFDDAVDGNVAVSDLDSDTRITFWETLNTDNVDSGGPSCASPSPLFDAGVVTIANGRSACDDIYRVALSDFAPISFVQDGYIYSINFTILDGEARDNDGNVIGTTLTCFPGAPSPLCAGAGVTPFDGTAAVYTPEFAPGTTELFVGAFWTVVPVPAPGVLGLMGLGLAGLGFAARKKKS